MNNCFIADVLYMRSDGAGSLDEYLAKMHVSSPEVVLLPSAEAGLL
jgi:hypothetical protein